ncbi:hypothetical protein NSE01_40300 [Novosphingobium sediminis]|jgi:hypothetical protein|uniref:Uncharacterized protein n=1 Tax=Novosphingobium sediminis TaxID=707214 RepID=A0A512AR57_9SPHN|nr:hypothetical protein [Novosphingobium sediminis]GEO02198.1 hypothetical protein NSE01_40300 [Novosphingobium sediminis]
MGLFNRIFLGHRIDDWASEYSLVAARTLNQVAADLIASAEQDVSNASLKDGLLAQSAFLQNSIAPKVREVAEPVAIEILNEANAALAAIVEEQAVWVRCPDYAEQPEGAFDGAKDIAAAAVPLAAGVATAASLPFAAVTTTTAWLGLVTTTTISWPVVLGGGALAGLGIATGLLNTAKIRDRTQARLRDRVRSFVVASLIGGDENSPSILQQLTAEFDHAAKRAKAL